MRRWLLVKVLRMVLWCFGTSLEKCSAAKTQSPPLTTGLFGPHGTTLERAKLQFQLQKLDCLMAIAFRSAVRNEEVGGWERKPDARWVG